MKKNKKYSKITELNNLKDYILNKLDYGDISDDFLYDFFRKNKLKNKKIVFGLIFLENFIPIDGYSERVRLILKKIDKNKRRDKIEDYKKLTENKLKESNISNIFWHDFFNKGNINLKNIVLGIENCEFKDFEPIKGYEDSITAYKSYKIEKDINDQKRKEENIEKRQKEYQEKVDYYRKNNKEDLSKIELDNIDEIIRLKKQDKNYYFNELWILIKENTIIENNHKNKEHIKNAIIEKFFNYIEPEINLYLAIELFPHLTNMLVNDFKIETVCEDLGFDVSYYPNQTKKKHKKEDYITIADILDNNYEDYTEATYISGMGLTTNPIGYNIEREIESIHYKVIKEILFDVVNFESFKENEKYDDYEYFIEAILETSFIIELLDNSFDYYQIIKNVNIEELFMIYNNEVSINQYKQFLLN